MSEPAAVSTPRGSALLGLLAGEDRLKAFAALVLGARSTDEVVARTGLPARSALNALTRLEAGGLVARSGDTWMAQRAPLQDAVAAAAGEAPDSAPADAPPQEAAVFRAFVRDGRISALPASRAKRLILLDYVARTFEPGVRYPERDVDATLRTFHDDHASLRRYLVDEGLLSRERGEYWRTGGTVLGPP